MSDLHIALDNSYSCSSYADCRYRVVNDAGAIIDPLFSSGVHLAMINALSAATTLYKNIREDYDEVTASEWYIEKAVNC